MVDINNSGARERDIKEALRTDPRFMKTIESLKTGMNLTRAVNLKELKVMYSVDQIGVEGKL
jgi:hypothetical protein